MYRLIQNHLEEVLAESNCSCNDAVRMHLEECEECRSQVAVMQEHAALLRTLRSPEYAPEQRPGFYARVMERIEAQTPESIWSLFFDSPFGRRVAVASMAVALCLGAYLFSSEQLSDAGLAVDSSARVMLTDASAAPDQDTVLVNLVTYRGQ